MSERDLPSADSSEGPVGHPCRHLSENPQDHAKFSGRQGAGGWRSASGEGRQSGARAQGVCLNLRVCIPALPQPDSVSFPESRLPNLSSGGYNTHKPSRIRVEQPREGKRGWRAVPFPSYEPAADVLTCTGPLLPYLRNGGKQYPDLTQFA